MKLFVLFVYLPAAVLLRSFFYLSFNYLSIQFKKKNSKKLRFLNSGTLWLGQCVSQTLGGAPQQPGMWEKEHGSRALRNRGHFVRYINVE